MAKWRPIKTAPKGEEVVVLAWIPNGASGSNDTSNWVYPTPFVACVIWDNGWWLLHPHLSGAVEVEPSHWMPCPAPPT